MHRRAKTYATGVALAVALSMGLTACTDSSGDDGGTDTKPGSSSSAEPPAEPGKFSTLPEPCGAVSKETLKRLLPAAEAAGEGGSAGKGAGDGESESPYEGEATVTYDTDRRVGCRWKSANSLATRNLKIDLERVVSYDPAVSDDEQAQLLYDERAGQAEIPTGDDSAPPEDGGESGDGEKGSQGEDGDAESGEKGGKGDGGTGGDGSEKSDNDGSGEPPADDETSKPEDEDLSPRMLDDIGDGAYIDDRLDTDDSGVHRDITLVFRSANVIATVEYDQWLTDKRRTPDSAELQEKARSVAEELAAGFDDN